MQPAPHGYSSTPLAKKLGIVAGSLVRVSKAPGHYLDLLQPLPPDVRISTSVRRNVDVWHAFTDSARKLAALLPTAMKQIKQDGCVWISWPKKASGVQTDLNENVIRDLALPLGLVDIKVCAVDKSWSGLKLVIRKALRK